MPKYLIRLEAGNLFMEEDGVPRRMGFIATRYIEAPTEMVAREIAMSIVRDQYSSIRLLNEKDDPYTLDVIEAGELETFGENSSPGAGATWFGEEDDDEQDEEDGDDGD